MRGKHEVGMMEQRTAANPNRDLEAVGGGTGQMEAVEDDESQAGNVQHSIRSW